FFTSIGFSSFLTSIGLDSASVFFASIGFSMSACFSEDQPFLPKNPMPPSFIIFTHVFFHVS
ncbi:MAG: hypothetical protein WCL18_11060, partial [bacterium]